MNYDPETDVWFNDKGEAFIKNSFNPSNEVYIQTNNDVWQVDHYGNTHYIDWSKIKLPTEIKNAYKNIAYQKLQKKSPYYMGKTKNLLENISKNLPNGINKMSDFNINNVMSLWEKMTPNDRIFFREYYKEYAQKENSSAQLRLYYELKTWQARTDTLNLKDVLYWDKKRGALTKEEEQVLKDFLKNYKNKTVKDLSLTIFCWLLIETLKRPSQILSMKKDSLKIVGNTPNEEYYVVIKPIKHQIAEDSRWWRISKELGEAIIYYKSLEEVERLENEFDRLIVFDNQSLYSKGQLSSATLSSQLKQYIEKAGLISPRTGDALHIKPLRLRHTGATRLAFSGISRDIIQEILEHDSPESAQAYIDAVGSELITQLERSDRNMGSVFKQIENAYFNGKVVSKSEEPPIIVPKIETTPLIVGGCSKNTLKDGGCDRHPFLSCYNGCPHFLAWRESDHYKSLEYVEQEIEKWEGFLKEGDNRAPLNEYKKVRDSIIEVITIIEDDKK